MRNKILLFTFFILGCFTAKAGVGPTIEEILSNPPSTDSVFEFIELKFGNSSAVGNKALLVIDGNNGALGVVKKVIDLAGTVTGTNGLVVLTANTNPYGSPTGAVMKNVLGSTNSGNLTNSSLSYLLVSYTNSSNLPAGAADLDADDNGTLELLNAGIVVLDAVGVLEGDNVNDKSYGLITNDTSLLHSIDGFMRFGCCSEYAWGRAKGKLTTDSLHATLVTKPSFGNAPFTPGRPNALATGIFQTKKSDYGFTIFPNPSNGVTTIKLSAERVEQVKVEVFNITGENVLTIFDGELNQGENRFNFYPEGLQKGVYFVSVLGEGIRTTQKLVITE